MTDRRLVQGRPRPSRRLLGLGISGSRVSHCSSVMSRVYRIPMLMPCGPDAAPGRRQPAVITSELPTNRKLSDDEVSPHRISEKPVCRPTGGKRISKPEADVAWQVSSNETAERRGKVVGQQCPNTMRGEHPALLHQTIPLPSTTCT
jgi:hypothetical protein